MFGDVSTYGAAELIHRPIFYFILFYFTFLFAANCPSLTGPINGELTGDSEHGSVVTISCSSGYTLTPPDSTLVCFDGQYNGTVPDCIGMVQLNFIGETSRYRRNNE